MTLINYTNVTDIGLIFVAINGATNNTFWVGILFALFCIIYLLLNFYGFKSAVLLASFGTLSTALLFRWGNLIGSTHLFTIFGIYLGIAMIIFWSSQKTSN